MIVFIGYVYFANVRLDWLLWTTSPWLWTEPQSPCRYDWSRWKCINQEVVSACASKRFCYCETTPEDTGNWWSQNYSTCVWTETTSEKEEVYSARFTSQTAEWQILKWPVRCCSLCWCGSILVAVGVMYAY